MATPIPHEVPAGDPMEDVPVAVPVFSEPGAARLALPVAQPVPQATPVEAEQEIEVPTPPIDKPAASAGITCPICSAANTTGAVSCSDCGYYFSEEELAAGAQNSGPSVPAIRVAGRYELRELISERQGVTRYRAIDHGEEGSKATPVMVIRQELPPPAPPAEPIEPDLQAGASEEVFPAFDDGPQSATQITDVLPRRPEWPSIAWERQVLNSVEDAGLPAELAYLTEDNFEYLVEEIPLGTALWDYYDDPDSGAKKRFGCLAELAELLHKLHENGAMLEGLRPDIVVVDGAGHPRLTDLADLLPLPFPTGVPIRGRLYSAPELLGGQAMVDARADLYSFGAMLYALHVGRELTEMDFERPGAGHPKPFVPRFPDIHPAFGRLMMKTFRRELDARFPTDEAAKEDPTGFLELVRNLEMLGRTFDLCRLEVASWTTTGIVRTGNEDAFALLHASESRQDDLGESALVLLCDGMGGYEAGEVAAALAIQAMRKTLLQNKPFSGLGSDSLFPTDPLTQMSAAGGHAGPLLDVESCKQQLKAALKEANRQVFAASRTPGSKRRGMGCTAEAVYVDGRHVVVGHVGDSRTYHLHEGRMVQLTRDQTLVNRLVELGTLTAEEAETHPRRNELQQAVGGQPDVDVGLYSGDLRPGDWVVVCSDGLSNHISPQDLQHMLQTEASSAEMAARRLVNLVNIEGATDNATVVVIRAT
jgi:serine/threonine protein phosphatase PrpC